MSENVNNISYIIFYISVYPFTVNRNRINRYFCFASSSVSVIRQSFLIQKAAGLEYRLLFSFVILSVLPDPFSVAPHSFLHLYRCNQFVYFYQRLVTNMPWCRSALFWKIWLRCLPTTAMLPEQNYPMEIKRHPSDAF